MVDLRAESHGFLGQTAISWYAKQNWGCVGLPLAHIHALESLRLDLVRRSSVVQVHSAASVKNNLRDEPRDLVVDRVVSEQQMVCLPKGHYFRLPVDDHTGPSEEISREFLRIIQTLPQGAHLHFHCRGGKGRTSTFLAMLAILLGAPTTPLDTILARMHQFNDYDLEATPAEDNPKAPFIQRRLGGLQDFYELSRTRS